MKINFKHEKTTDKYVPTVMFDQYYMINIYDRYFLVIMYFLSNLLDYFYDVFISNINI